MIVDTVLDADRGDTNVFDIDLNVPIDALNDKVWFTIKRTFEDLDADAVLKKGLNVAGLTGIVVTDAPNGKVQVTCDEGELKGVVQRVLLFDVQIKQGARYTTVSRGVVRLSGEVTLST